MGHRIIRFDNGCYAIFSTVVDNVVFFAGSRQEVIDWELEQILERERERLERWVDNQNQRPGLFMTVEDALRTCALNNTEESVAKLKGDIENVAARSPVSSAPDPHALTEGAVEAAQGGRSCMRFDKDEGGDD